MTAASRLVLIATNRQWTALLLVITSVFAIAYGVHGATSWFWFERGVPVLLDPDGAPGGLHLYAAHPELQIGPASFLVAAPFVYAGAAGTLLVAVLMLACGGAIAFIIGDLAARDDGVTVALRLALLLAAPVWVELSVSVAHLDDALALLLATGGLWAVRRDRPYLAAVSLALAVDCKPWLLGFAALLLLFPRDVMIRAAAAWLGVVAIAWLPFVLADPHTLDALRFQIRISPASVLRAVDIAGSGTPSWCRHAQFIGGLLLAGFVALRRRPEAVPLIVVGVRMLLDPATHIYFDAGLVVSSVIFDVLVARNRVPWVTAGVVAFVFVPGYVVLANPASAPPAGLLRAVFLLAVVIAALVPLSWWRRSRQTAVSPTRTLRRR